MAFLDDVDQLDRKQEQGIPRPVLVAGAVVLAVVALLAILGVLPASGGGITVVSGEGASALPGQDGKAPAEDVSLAGEGTASGSGAASGAASGAQPEASVPAAPEVCYVYVVGAVANPGVYGVAPTARVNDAIEAAGGMAEDADITAVNLARTIVDGEQIHVPRIGEEPPVAAAPTPAASADAAGAVGTESPGNASAPVGASANTSSGKVNINTADSAELQTLKGVGEATAEKIIASREAEGPFTAPEDLKRVSGIGEKKYAALADDIVV